MPLPGIVDEHSIHQHVRIPQSHPRLSYQQHHYGISLGTRDGPNALLPSFHPPHRDMDSHHSSHNQSLRRPGQPSNVVSVATAQHDERSQRAHNQFRMPVNHDPARQPLPHSHSHRPDHQHQGSHQRHVHQVSQVHMNQRPSTVGGPAVVFHQGSASEQNYHNHHHQYLQQQKSRGSGHDRAKPADTLRIVSHHERHHLDKLMSTLFSGDKITMESLRRNESLPRTRQILRSELGEILRTIPPNTPIGQVDFNKPLYTNSDTDLTILCRAANDPDNPTTKTDSSGMTFTEFTRRAKEAAARNSKVTNSQTKSPQAPFPATMTSAAKLPRSASGSRVILSPASRMPVGGDAALSIQRDKGIGKGKGKGKVRRRIWEEVEDNNDDILDELNV